MATSHYSIPEANRNSGFLTSDWNAALQKIDAEMWKLPGYKRTLTSNDSIDNLTDDGFYYLTNSLPTGVPTETQWCFLLQISNSAIKQQYILRPAGGWIYARELSGSPSTWTEWHCICGHSAVTRITYGSNSYVEYWRNGQCGCLKMYYNVSDGTIEAWQTKQIATLPAGFRPATSVLMRGIVDRANDEGTAFLIESSGAVKISTRHNAFSTSGDVLQGTLTYPIRY